MSTSYYVMLELGPYDNESFLLGFFMAALFLHMSLDSLYTSTIAAMVCIHMQVDSDKATPIGSPERARVKGQYELAALRILGVDTYQQDTGAWNPSPAQKKAVKMASNEEDDELPTSGSTESSTPRGRSSSTNRKGGRKASASPRGRSPAASKKRK